MFKCPDWEKEAVMSEIYEEVTAVVSPNVITVIQEMGLDVLLTLHKYIRSACPSLCGQKQQLVVTGTLHGVSSAEDELHDMLELLKTLHGESFSMAGSVGGQVFPLPEGCNSGDSAIVDDVKLTSEDSNSVGQHCEKESLPSAVKSFPDTEVCQLPNSSNPREHLVRKASSSKYVLNRKFRKLKKSHSDALSKSLEKMKLSSSDGENRVNGDSTSAKARHKTAKDYDIARPFKYFCQICSFKTKRNSHLQKHMLVHSKEGISIHKCPECDFTTVRQSHMRRHEVVHSSFASECTECSYKTVDPKLLSRHVRLKHLRIVRKHDVHFNCSDCSYKTTRSQYLERHKRIDCKKMYNCELCSYKTSRKEHYYRHLNSVHLNERNYLCHLCGKAFKRADALQQHHQTHEGIRDSNCANFKCDVCQKSFRSSSNLREHKAVHVKERLFLCEVCGASFKTRSVQRKHIISIHNRPRSYTCKLCTKSFNTLYAMKRHQKIHTESKGTSTDDAKQDPADILAEKLQQVAMEPSAETLHNDIALPSPTVSSIEATSAAQETLTVDVSFANDVTNSIILPQFAPSLLQHSQNTTVLFLTSAPPPL